MVDELKRLQATIHAMDHTLRTEVQMTKTETANNMKRHSGNILTWLINQYMSLSKEWPRFASKVFVTLDGIANKAEHAEDMLTELFEWKNTMSKLLELFRLQLDNKLDKIDSNTDLKNSDKNSLGNQINDLVDTADRISQAIINIDKRIPGIDMNGAGLMSRDRSGTADEKLAVTAETSAQAGYAARDKGTSPLFAIAKRSE
jgi:hypothetical protein